VEALQRAKHLQCLAMHLRLGRRSLAGAAPQLTLQTSVASSQIGSASAVTALAAFSSWSFGRE